MKTSFKKNNSEFSEQNKENPMPENLRTNSERIAKVIARAGLCSRREAERWIVNGQVKLNHKVITECGVNVTSKDIIEVNGQPLPSQTITKLWLYHKQRGHLVTNHDPEGRLTIFEDLKSKIDTRLISVGRLDMDSEGLLLLTNDGDLARKIELPLTGWLRKYRVRVHGYVLAKDLEPLKNGITVDGIKYGRIANKRSFAGGRVRPLFHPSPPNKVSINVAGFPSSSPSAAPVPSYFDGSNESGMFAARVRKRAPLCVCYYRLKKRRILY